MEALSTDKLFMMQDLATRMLCERGITIPTPPTVAKPLEAFVNAKYEQIACAGLKPRYTGSPSDLIPRLNLIHMRGQNKKWYLATFLIDTNGTSIDLILEFSKVSELAVLTRAKAIWDDPRIATNQHLHGTEVYNTPLFGVFLTNSLSNEFLMMLYSLIDPKYSMDGPLLLFTMCHHIRCNHIAFVELVKDQIRQLTLANHKDDMQAYLWFLQNNLWRTKIPLFQQAVLKWHRDYMEGTLKITPPQLVQKADEESQILPCF